MGERAELAGGLRERALDEFKAMLVLALYLYICLGAVILYKSAILKSVGVEFEIWGIAAVKALVLAKFMLLARMLHLEKRHRNKPLIWPICLHAFAFLLVLLMLTAIEELLIGVYRHRPVIESLGEIVGTSVIMGGATCIIMFLILVPYSAFICLADALGEQEVFRLFFVDRSPAAGLRDRLAGQAPTAE